MEFLVENWYMILGGIALILLLVGAVYAFLKHPTNSQVKKIKEWLLIAVIEAEKSLGSGTGELKLSFVYDKFITKFPWMSKIISLEQFKGLVDLALTEMKELMREKEEVKQYIEDKK